MDGSSVLGSPPAKDEFWTPELEIKLAEKIRSFPCLYDSTHQDWKNKPYRQDLWEMIAAEMSATAEQCKKKYKGLRDKAVREYRLGKESKWPAASAMSFVLPLARIRHENSKKPSKSGSGGGGSYDDSNNYGFDSGSFDVDGDDHDDGYNPRPSLTSIPSAIPPVVPPQPGLPLFNGFNHLAFPKYEPTNSSSKRKLYDMEEYQNNADYYGYNQGGKSVKPPSSKSSSSVIITRPQPLPLSNGFNFGHLGTINSNGTQQPQIYNKPICNETNGGGSSSRRSSTNTQSSSHQKHGSSYHFGQYIATALETLSTEAANDARQKIQELLFKAQIKYAVNKTGSKGSHPVVVFNENTGKEEVMHVDKDLSHSKN